LRAWLRQLYLQLSLHSIQALWCW